MHVGAENEGSQKDTRQVIGSTMCQVIGSTMCQVIGSTTKNGSHFKRLL